MAIREEEEERREKIFVCGEPLERDRERLLAGQWERHLQMYIYTATSTPSIHVKS